MPPPEVAAGAALAVVLVVTLTVLPLWVATLAVWPATMVAEPPSSGVSTSTTPSDTSTDAPLASTSTLKFVPLTPTIRKGVTTSNRPRKRCVEKRTFFKLGRSSFVPGRRRLSIS